MSIKTPATSVVVPVAASRGARLPNSPERVFAVGWPDGVVQRLASPMVGGRIITSTILRLEFVPAIDSHWRASGGMDERSAAEEEEVSG